MNNVNDFVLVFLLLIFDRLTHCSGVSIVDIEQVMPADSLVFLQVLPGKKKRLIRMKETGHYCEI